MRIVLFNILLYVIVCEAQSVVTRDDIHAVIQAYIQQMAKDQHIEAECEFRSIPDSIEVDAAGVQLRVAADSHAVIRNTTALPIEILAHGELKKRVVVSLVVHTFEQVLVAQRKINRSIILSPNFFAVQRVETTQMHDQVFNITADLSHYRSTQMINIGKVLTTTMTELIPVVKNGARVAVHVKSGNLLVSTFGETKHDGNIGDKIMIRIPTTGALLQGVIVDDTTVNVVLP